MERPHLLGGPLVPEGFSWLIRPQEDVCFYVAEEEADPPSDRLAKVKHFQTVIYVLVGQTIEGFLEVYEEN